MRALPTHRWGRAELFVWGEEKSAALRGLLDDGRQAEGTMEALWIGLARTHNSKSLYNLLQAKDRQTKV